MNVSYSPPSPHTLTPYLSACAEQHHNALLLDDALDSGNFVTVIIQMCVCVYYCISRIHHMW